MGSTSRLLSIISALVLACLTLSVFALQKDVGPQGAVKRLYQTLRDPATREASPKDRMQLLSSVIVEPADQVSFAVANTVLETVAISLASNPEISINQTQMGEQRSEAIVTVTVQQGGRKDHMAWVVQKLGREWKVNVFQSAQLTLEFYQRGLMKR